MTASTPETSPAAPLPEAPSRSFWEVAGSAFTRRPLNVVACVWIGFLLLLSAFLPFVANGRPYTALVRQPDGTFIREFPLFRQLTGLDLTLLLVLLAVIVYAIIHRSYSRKNLTREARFAARMRWLLTLLGVTIVAGASLITWYKTPLDPRDYRRFESLIQSGDIKDAVFAPVHWSPYEQEPLIAGRRYETGSRDHWLGTDSVSRDALSRLLWSTRTVIGIGFVAQLIALTIGVTIGALIGYYVRKVDLIGMRLVEIFEAIPTLILILIFIALYGRNLFLIMVILGVTGWTGIARYTRAEVLRLRRLEYVQAANALGLSTARVVFRHILPNGLTPVLVATTFGIAGAIGMESSLSFMGLGVEPPTPSWGSMIEDGRQDVFRPWLIIPPGVMIFLTVFAYNIIGEGLRDAIDPRLNKIR